MVQGPFHLEATVRVLQRRPHNCIDVWDGAHYLRVLTISRTPVLVEVQNLRTIREPDVRYSALNNVRVPIATLQRDIDIALHRILGLDIEAISIRSLVDEFRLHLVADALFGMRPPRYVDLFETLINVVPFQQVSLDSGMAVVARLVERFGVTVQHNRRRFSAAPLVTAIAHANPKELRECGLSNRKALTLVELARAIESGDLDERSIGRMSTPDALKTLERYPGIGPWSAALILLRGFGRFDVFPPDDVAAVRTLCGLMHLESISALHSTIERLGPNRGYLYFFGLAANLFQKGLIHAAASLPRR